MDGSLSSGRHCPEMPHVDNGEMTLGSALCGRSSASFKKASVACVADDVTTGVDVAVGVNCPSFLVFSGLVGAYSSSSDESDEVDESGG